MPEVSEPRFPMPDPRRTLRIASVEIKLQLRSLAFWAVAVLWQAAVIFTLVDKGEYPPGRKAFGVISGFALFLTTAAVLYFMHLLTREDAQGAGDLVDALAHRTSEMVWGKLLGGLALWVTLGLEVVAVYGVEQLGTGLPPGPFVRGGAYMLAFFLASTVMAAGLAFALGALLGRTRLAYVVGTAAWVALIGLGPLFVVQTNEPTRARWLEVLGLADVQSRSFSELWGLFPNDGLGWGQVLWLGGAGLALAALAAVVHKRWRDRDFRRRVSAAVLVAGVLAAGGGLAGSRAAFATQLASFDAQLEAYGQPTGPSEEFEPAGEVPQAPSGQELAVVAYRLDFTLGPGHALAATGSMTVRNPGRVPLTTLPLTLNPALAIDEVTARFARVTRVVRSGEFVSLELDQALGAGEETALDLAYHGRVWDFMPYLNTGLELVAAVDEGGVWLPAGYGWYPLGGHQALARPSILGMSRTGRDPGLYYLPVSFPPADYELSFRWEPAGGGQRELVLAGPFGPLVREGDRAVLRSRAATPAGVFLIGSPELEAATGADSAVVSAPGLAPAARTLAAGVGPALDFYRTVLPVEVPRQLPVVAVPDLATSPAGPRPGEGVVLAENVVANLAKMDSDMVQRLTAEGGPNLESAILDIWLPSADDLAWSLTREAGPENEGQVLDALDVRNAFRTFLAAAAAGATRSPEAYRARIEATPRSGLITHTSVRKDTLAALDRLYLTEGPRGLRELLSRAWSDLLAVRLSPARLGELLDEIPTSGKTGGSTGKAGEPR